MTDPRPISFSMKDDIKLITEFLSWLDKQDGLDFTDNAALARRFLEEREEASRLLHICFHVLAP